ncbi:unnamed protein product [Spodoptera littoralis]|uniref:Chitin-binding type-2 domain-containing protein n=1 Tax=Spodoptera littoralis TaxID=7109 RepID=A0A9P0N0J6_SPOLI|nr:unnamed protein product [Spodoptera littoralis]CAH1640176.1 unnamed protein product [Spodoptera littoralis]
MIKGIGEGMKATRHPATPTVRQLMCLTTWAEAQNGRGQHQDHNGHGWDIRLAVPGEPGSYYADLETNCQVFRVCTVGSTYGFQSFLCPNGTLFNQAVFVCDWWMNVDCQNSQQFFNNNNDKFENLRLGPQLMKDIKKMLTHPMLNPYDKNAMKSNLIVMQDYKPPFGQLFPNGALLAGPERAPNNVYVPAKQIQQNLIQGNQNDYAFSASTPDPRYIPAPLNFVPLQRDTELFQRQRQNEPFNSVNSIQNARVQTTQISQTGNLISNGHAGRLTQNSNGNFVNNNGYAQAPRPTQLTNTFSQRQTSQVVNNNQGNTLPNQRVQNNRPRTQYSEPRRLPQTNNDVPFSKIQNNGNNNQNKQPYTYSPPTTNIPKYSNNLDNPAGRELKENLVSTIKDVPSTVITKTLTYSRLVQEPKPGKPKSRITVKTWIVKPTKAAKLIAEPTPYTYSRPSAPTPSSPSPTARLIEENTPYVYEKPTVSPQTERIVSQELDSELESEEPYVYSRPTPAAKQIETTEIQTTRIFIAPSTTLPTRPTFSGRLNLPQTSPLPTKASRLYLTPSPFMSTARFYLPPPRNPTTLPRLYLPANNIQQPYYYQSSQLRASPTIPTSTIVAFTENVNQTPFSVSRQSRINSNNQNLTFTDILTKEKLDITVNDIVKDTDDILKTASPPQYTQYRKEFKSLEYPENYSSSRTTTDSGENLTSQVPTQTTTVTSQSSRIVATPATSLQPPNENFIFQNNNRLSNLPFFKETGIPNTIERTVSIKITIPERIAAFLFKNRSDSDYDKLEILNTGSSNYLVMSNNLLTKSNAFNFIPIAKLIGNQHSNNFSDSQALVYSFLTDSINVAREYNNRAQQEIISSTSTPAPPQFQNLNSEKLSQITNQISQLTSSQYSNNNLNSFGTNANIIPTPKTNTNQLSNQFTANAKYTDESSQAQQVRTNQFTPSQQSQGEFYSSRIQVPNTQSNILSTQNLYSGQLYQWSVPDVTQIFNNPSAANIVNPSNIQQQTTQMLTLQQNTNQNSPKQSSPQYEVVKAETIALNPAKLQLEPPNEPEQFNSQETLNRILNSGNGISAQLQDKIVSTIPHPLEENKLLTYKKDQSYYLYTKLEDNTIEQNSQTNQQSNSQINTAQNAKFVEGTNNNMANLVSFQLIPSVSYELEDEKEQQKFLNAFQIDEFGAPRDITKSEKVNQGQIMTSSVDYSVEHPTTVKQNEQYVINPLYSGPSSYTAPQSSVGSLESRQIQQNNFNSRLEDFESSNHNGYPKERPARHFFS